MDLERGIMIARVQLWGRTIGAVFLDDGDKLARFQ